ncbi:MAG: TIGR03905 family TSCPD domain-containing protein, partial [Solobacterium sp.]|nr:TIGR03905 family TSCPD domain-containing protein [Solobacterium sp.]
MSTFVYKPKGVCSSEMRFELNGETIESLTVTNGCNGNLKGIAALVKGRNVNDVIAALDGIKCGFKQTSCPDQIAKG